MKTDAILMKVSGIKCDRCDYKDMDVKVEDYKTWLNRPCPKCGANLLTEQDFKSTMILLKVARFLNRILPKVERPNPNDVNVSVEMNGTGEVKFVRKD